MAELFSTNQEDGAIISDSQPRDLRLPSPQITTTTIPPQSLPIPPALPSTLRDSDTATIPVLFPSSLSPVMTPNGKQQQQQNPLMTSRRRILPPAPQAELMERTPAKPPIPSTSSSSSTSVVESLMRTPFPSSTNLEDKSRQCIDPKAGIPPAPGALAAALSGAGSAGQRTARTSFLNSSTRTHVHEDSFDMIFEKDAFEKLSADGLLKRDDFKSRQRLDSSPKKPIQGQSAAAKLPPEQPRQQQHQKPPIVTYGSSWNSTDVPPSTDTTTKKKAPKKDVPRIPAAEERDIENDDRIRLGICAMATKARSRPMAEILSRLNESLFKVIFFDDDMILNKPVEEWPICDVLIAFFSKGYPLPKAMQYVKLRKPFIVNDLEMQETLQDRRRVYDLLEKSGIDVPRHVYLSRDGYVSSGTGDGNGRREHEIQEFDDYIQINGVVINKPFVEKPTNAEDHNIAIYYPTSAGGGCKKLFRKVGNRSSEFYPFINEVRRDGSYIYEEFVETQGTDVKMYTVGPDYGHAEARKSPAVDGKVERNSDGKELRFPVILTFREKEIARRIVIVFKQFVCGFDILRVQEGHSVVSYVCDVNGWSFVKNSRKYYDDCAQILEEHLLAKMKPAALTTFSTLDPLVTTSLNHLDDEIAESDHRPAATRNFNNFLTRATRMLKGGPKFDDSASTDGLPADTDTQSQVSAVDYQVPLGSPLKNHNFETSDLLSSAAATLMEGALPVREFPNNLTSEPASLVPSSSASLRGGKVSDSDDDELDEQEYLRRRRGSFSAHESTHQEELRCVLAIVRHGDRTPKQKLKVDMTEPHILEYFHKHCKDCTNDLKVKAKSPLTEFLQTVKTTLHELSPPNTPSPPQEENANADEPKLDLQQQQESSRSIRLQLTHMRDILERWKIHGLNRKLQIKPKQWEEYNDPFSGEMKRRAVKVQLILKWGGNLTKLGEKQAIALGHKHRHDMYPDAPGGGILRLHSTFRHDLKIKTSDEGRVMKTAAAFAKGLLELEGDLPPILVSLVHKEKGSMHMLDPTGNKEVKNDLDACKGRITANLQKDIDIATASEEELYQLVGPKELTALREAVEECGNPRKILMKIHDTMGELLTKLEEMWNQLGTGDEHGIEGGEGLRGNNEEDVALSGVKLYKGETLLELTERWRFIYDRLYDRKTDKFDMSRIPDVHDNVRFDVLHNPHLGLTETLQKLYNYAKIMADCVVPQEYGTTLAEKRDLGVKICHSLLEKIKYDLNVARTDNKVDMRYMINMNYEADLPINTMGRRIRTRLYFTSESHLHTVLNVFRFAQHSSKGLLSEHGTAIVNATRELCYLTQIVMRVFEDNRRRLEDPRRFRVEILFSPGAAATPSHIEEDEREHDAARYGTEPLQVIGREGLTCADVEAFFEQAIMAGKSDDEDGYEVASTSTAAERQDRKNLKKAKSVDLSDVASVEGSAAALGDETAGSMQVCSRDVAVILPKSIGVKKITPPNNVLPEKKGTATHEVVVARRSLLAHVGDGINNYNNKDQTNCPDPEQKDDSTTAAAAAAALARRRQSERKYFWGTVAVTSLVLGMSCLVLAFDMANPGRRRRWPRRLPE